MRLLVVTAVDAERDAVRAALPVSGDAAAQAHVETVGVGPAEAAAGTAAALAAAGEDVGLVLCAGIAGGFPPLGAGDLAVATSIVFADLGAQTAGGFTAASELGFGTERYDVPARLAVELADLTGGHLGTVITVATVTGTAERREALRERYPDVTAEAMEGAGVAAAARARGVAFAELRAVSNPVGPRDRAAWRIPEALAALGTAVAAVVGAGAGPDTVRIP